MAQPTIANLVAEGTRFDPQTVTRWVLNYTDSDHARWAVEAARIIFGGEVITFHINGQLGAAFGGGLHIGYDLSTGTFVTLSTEDPQYFSRNPLRPAETPDAKSRYAQNMRDLDGLISGSPDQEPPSGII
jgi:hypothetical protein